MDEIASLASVSKHFADKERLFCENVDPNYSEVGRFPELGLYGVSDDEFIEATVMDRSFQLVLDCVDTDEAPISLGTLVTFRKLLIETQMDRRLVERTIEIASQSQGWGS